MPALCRIDDIPNNHSKGFTIDSHSYLLVKKEGQIFAYENRCPHLGIELNWQEDRFLDPDAVLIQCATHGALFLIENGQCVSGPCQGKFLTAIPVNMEDGVIHLQTDK